MNKRRLNKNGMIALCIITLIIVIIFIAVIDKIRYEMSENKSEDTYQLIINDTIIKPNEIISKKNYVFDHSTNKVSEISIPKGSVLKLTKNYSLKDSDGKSIKGEVTYLPDGEYTLKTEKGDYKYTYKLKVDNDFSVEINETHAITGGYLVASFSDLNKDEKVTLDPKFNSSKDFIFDKENTLIPIANDNDTGEYKIEFKSEKSSTSKMVTITKQEVNHVSLYWNDYEAKKEKETDEYKKFLKASSAMTEERLYSQFQNPANGNYITYFGDSFYINNNTKPDVINLGIDISNSLNTSIQSTSAGKVIYTGEFDVHGKVVVIDHGFGIVSTYSHLNEITVSVGDEVTNDTVIGKMGDTGNVKGVHLNFEIHINGVPVNPILFLHSELEF